MDVFLPSFLEETLHSYIKINSILLNLGCSFSMIISLWNDACSIFQGLKLKDKYSHKKMKQNNCLIERLKINTYTLEYPISSQAHNWGHVSAYIAWILVNTEIFTSYRVLGRMNQTLCSLMGKLFFNIYPREIIVWHKRRRSLFLKRIHPCNFFVCMNTKRVF